MKQTEGYTQQINQRINWVLEKVSDLSEETIRWKPSADEWSIMEVLCHLEEANLFWMKELQRVVHDPDTEWGRTLQHEGRLEAVRKANQRGLDEVLKGIGKTRDLVRETLSSITDRDLKIRAPHRNPKFGIQDMAFLLDHFMVEHLDTHIDQIQRNIMNVEKDVSKKVDV